MSDGAQALLPSQLAGIIRTCNLLHKTIDESETPFSSDLGDGKDGHR